MLKTNRKLSMKFIMQIIWVMMPFLVRSDSDDEKDEVLKQFDGAEIKIFFSAYSHYHLAVKTKGDRKEPFVAVNKYINMDDYSVNDMAKLNVNGDGYEITIGGDMLCTSKNKNIIKCGEDDTDTVWKILPTTFGYSIQKNKKCLTKSLTEALTLKKCTGDDDQKFDFKKYTGMDKCDEAQKQTKNSEGANTVGNKSIDIHVIPPMYNYGYDNYHGNYGVPPMPYHPPELLSNVYGYTGEENHFPVEHTHDLAHVHLASAMPQQKLFFEPEKVITIDKNPDTSIRTLAVAHEYIPRPIAKPLEPVDAAKPSSGDKIIPKNSETPQKSTPSAKYKLFEGFASNDTREADKKAQKLFGA